MLLIIPAIQIKNGKCVYRAKNLDGTLCPDDPVEMAKLWRTENAKSLHVTDIDGTEAGRLVNLDVIKDMLDKVDIPIELGGGICSFEEAKKAFDIGVYRILIGTLFLENPNEAVQILKTYGDRKIVIGLVVENGKVKTKGWTEDSTLAPIDAAFNAKSLGFKRIVYRDVINEGGVIKPNFICIKELAEKTKLRVTASGGVNNLDDLLKMQELEKYGVDSIVIGEGLYENKFSCQGIWRLCESKNYPYTAKV